MESTLVVVVLALLGGVFSFLTKNLADSKLQVRPAHPHEQPGIPPNPSRRCSDRACGYFGDTVPLTHWLPEPH